MSKQIYIYLYIFTYKWSNVAIWNTIRLQMWYFLNAASLAISQWKQMLGSHCGMWFNIKFFFLLNSSIEMASLTLLHENLSYSCRISWQKGITAEVVFSYFNGQRFESLKPNLSKWVHQKNFGLLFTYYIFYYGEKDDNAM